MQITVLAVGSRGDVQPAVALGVRLRRAGHAVRLGSYAQFADLAAAHGLAFTPIAGDVQALLQSAEGRAVLDSRNPLRLIQMIHTHSRASATQSWADITAACAEAEALVSLGMFYYAAEIVATTRGIPHITAQLQPLLPTGAFPAPLLPALPLRTATLNRASHRLADLLYWQGLRGLVNQTRRAVGLPALSWRPTFARAVQNGMPALFAYSPLVVPAPPDWPTSAQVTGFWFLEAQAAYTPPAKLLRFLEAGEQPVYIGFGSMNTRDPRRTGELALRALKLSGRRGLLMRGWGGIDANALPPDVLLIDEVPHSWLFPRVAAVVHHGGAGTTAAGLRAGVPSILIPFFVDQPFWAERVAGLGVGPAPLARRLLTAERLARSIDIAMTPEVRARAAAVARSLAAEDGVGLAASSIEGVLQRSAPSGGTEHRRLS